MRFGRRVCAGCHRSSGSLLPLRQSCPVQRWAFSEKTTGGFLDSERSTPYFREPPPWPFEGGCRALKARRRDPLSQRLSKQSSHLPDRESKAPPSRNAQCRVRYPDPLFQKDAILLANEHGPGL